MRNGGLGSVSENVQCGTLGRGPQHRGEIVTSEIAKLGRGNELSFQRSPDDEVNGALGFWFVRALAVEKAALDANLLPAAVRVLAAILYFMNNTTKRAWPSYERIHEITGYSRDTIERAIRQLIGSGYLFRERNAPITGGRALVHYGLRALHPSHIDRMISAAVEEFRRQRPAPEADPVINSGVGLTQGKTAGSAADPGIFAASDPGIFVRQEPDKYEPVFSLSETPVSDHGEPGPQPKSRPVYTEEFARSTLRSLRPSGGNTRISGTTRRAVPLTNGAS